MNKNSLRINVSPLTQDYSYAYDKVGDFFNGDFRNPAAFQHQAESLKFRDLKREPLAAVLLKINQDYGCGSQTRQNIDRLIQAEACAVVTGQQVGLFSGPLYTIYKSLTTIKLAERLNQTCRGTYVPVFWMASDDHDFAEINHINVLDKNNQIEKIQYRSSLSNLKIPASNLVFTSVVSSCVQHLCNLTRDSEFKAEIFGHLREAYQPDRSFVEAFARWMTRLFGSYGLILADASHPALKELGKDVFVREISENSPSTERALDTSRKLSQAGYHTQIHLHEGKLNLFFTDQERRSIQSKSGGFCIKGMERTYKERELVALVNEKPELFSPNVLLRPIYQDALFPTVAYVGGPAEIAYFAQMKRVYESFGLPMPVIYPRKSATIVEKNVRSVLERYKVEIQDIWQNADRMINEISRKNIPESTGQVLHAAASHLEQDFHSIKQEIMAFEPALEKTADLTLRRMDQQLKFLEQKILREARKRNKIVTRQLLKAKNTLHPGNRLQERVFNIVPFLIKYGYPFLDKLCRAIDMDNFDHQVIKL